MDSAVPRRIQVTGRNTFIVSLPHDWARKSGIKRGDAVYIHETDEGALALTLRMQSGGMKACTINISPEKAESGMRNIVSAYVGGAGKIILKGKGVYTIAEEARRVLSGVEISEEEEDRLVLQVLAFDDLDIDGIIKREFSVTRSMFDLAGSAFSEKADLLTEISRKEDEVDRLYILLLRKMCMGKTQGREAVFKAIAAKSIEKVSDHIEDICVSGRCIAPNRDIAALVSVSSAIFSAAYDSFSKNELDQRSFYEAKGVYQEQNRLFENNLKREKNVQKMLTLRSLSERCNKVLRYSEDIMESANDILFARMEG